ncbi:TPA: hypothetical protein QC153_005618 [Bacillus cereus]|uniref:Uncharacterized protein n=1 Tax=Bacillus cereus (strain Q1) TaxID=361100 RepID=B9J668_BACCQ|nr:MULTISPECIES: hypothetical protein [Bacillus]ACM15863.1 hypothetical protein BCQ_PI129 [Bacillus cereus Q1]EJR09268.1 hypothetical protein II9_05476 [Bacillus cereus MSX-D12]MDV8113481.1 hypothetical protein [Bacillus sp. BAU-SS-2023]MCB5899852.1 hypothetical protein [Bacillus cereus]MCG3791595.1 hypothetical protein [Bacillus sp. UTDS19-33BHI26]
MKIKLKGSLAMLFIFSLFFIALFFDEKAAVSGVLMCFFSILAKEKFSRIA